MPAPEPLDLADPTNDFVRLVNRLDELDAAVARIEATISTVAELAARIKQEVTPFLDGLAKSPLIKMLGVKR
jgi:ABC-type transporter Mla subunit MlaD